VLGYMMNRCSLKCLGGVSCCDRTQVRVWPVRLGLIAFEMVLCKQKFAQHRVKMDSCSSGSLCGVGSSPYVRSLPWIDHQ
jgi:hypothetical protein